MQKTAIVVPCYNEGQRLDLRAFAERTSEDPSLHFLFVDDGSTDDTREKLEALCRKNPAQMAWIRLDRNSGKAEAVRAGFLRAIGSGFVNIGYWDADLATPLDVIPRFCEILERPGISLVMGSRVRLLGRRIERNVLRHYTGRAFATCASLVLGLPVYDTQCGAKMFRSGGELAIVFGKPFRSRWTFDVEILARLVALDSIRGTGSLADATVEYPLEVWTDVPGSKVRMRDFFRGLVELFGVLRFLRSRRARRRFFGDRAKPGGPAGAPR